MDCRTARLLLDYARPLATELDEGDGEALASHMVECSACAAIQSTDRKFDETMGRAMRDVTVPPELRGRLLQRLGTQRDLWYRRRIVWPAIGAAAAVLLAWLGIHELTRPSEPNLARFQEEINSAATPGPTVARWLERHDGKEPPGFDPGLLTHSALADFQGKQVPLLEYRRGADQVWVYVLHDQDFNLQALNDPAQGPSGRYAVAVLKNPDEPHVAYVVVYTGPDLSPFMQTARPAT